MEEKILNVSTAARKFPVGAFLTVFLLLIAVALGKAYAQFKVILVPIQEEISVPINKIKQEAALVDPDNNIWVLDTENDRHKNGIASDQPKKQ